jgi:hypothetical protein
MLQEFYIDVVAEEIINEPLVAAHRWTWYSQMPVWPIHGSSQEMQGSNVHTMQKG